MVMTTTRDTINSVLGTELARDPRTLYLGETISYMGSSATASGLYERFGSRQVIETPVSENGIFGAALGLALGGYRPIVEIYTADFLLAVANEVMNDIPKWRQQHALVGGLPITIRGWMGSTLGRGPEHSQCMEAFLHHAPGLTIVCPGTPRDTAGLLRASIQSDEPVVFLEHRRIYDLEDELPDPDFVLSLGKSEVVREGRDITIVAWSWMRHEAVKAADSLAEDGIKATIIDPRTIKPLDDAPIIASARATGRLLVCEESFVTGNIGAEIITRAVTACGPGLRCNRVAMPDKVHPYSAAMESEIIPGMTEIVRAARNMVKFN